MGIGGARVLAGLCEKTVKERNFTSKTDNFDSSNKDTFNQRYFLNSDFFNGTADEPVVFLFIGGEAVVSKLQLCWAQFPVISMAYDHRALVVSLEHRFFGRSYPYFVDGLADSSVETLRLLSIQQAVADLANFIQNFEFDGKNMKHAKWVLFGGSYPGNLCAYMRLKHPDLTVGGVCSSALLDIKVEYPEYDEISEYALRDWNLTAAENIKQACKDIKNLELDDREKKSFYKEMGMELPPDYKNSTEIRDLVYALTCGRFSTVAQDFSPRFFDHISRQFTQLLGENETYAELFMELSFNYLNATQSLLQMPSDDTQDRFDVTDPDQMSESHGRSYAWLLCDNALGLFPTSSESSMFGASPTLEMQIHN